jgi:ATP-dependent Clp protease ATP-binding subunit ClpA
MFERFTEEARRVVVVAQTEAREGRVDHIGTEHLLLGLAIVAGPGSDVLRAAGVELRPLREAVLATADDDLDPGALAALGIDLATVREKTEAAFGVGALSGRRHRRQPDGHLPFTPYSKKSLELSLRAAVRRGDRSIDTRHLLLGVLGADDQRVTAILRRLGVDPGDLRRRAEGDADAA